MTQDAVPGGGQRRREIDRGRRLADAALLVGERDDAGAARGRDGARLRLKPGEAHGRPVASEE